MEKEELIILMGEYVVIYEKSEYDKISVPGIQTCVAVSILDQKNKKLGVVHIDSPTCVKDAIARIMTKINGCKKIKKDDQIEVRLFGGDGTSKFISEEIRRVLELYNIKEVEHIFPDTLKADKQTINVTCKLNGKYDISEGIYIAGDMIDQVKKKYPERRINATNRFNEHPMSLRHVSEATTTNKIS